jgi:hypothetical protein
MQELKELCIIYEIDASAERAFALSFCECMRAGGQMMDSNYV